eukprot:7885977-Karenia_brevis.AAC.1
MAEVLRERKRYRASKTPVWYELGVAAARLVFNTRASDGERYATQRSSLLGDADVALSALDGSIAAASAMEIAAWMEQGDARVWAAMQGHPLVAWAPADSSALGRFVSSYLKAADDPSCPAHVRLLVPMETFPEGQSLETIRDLWWHPLMSDKYAAVVRRMDFAAQPMEMVLPGASGPRHVHMGLA